MFCKNRLESQTVIKSLHEFLYTPIDEAIERLDERQKRNIILPHIDIPEPLQNCLLQGDMPTHPTAIMLRQAVTPNFEMRRVIQLCEQYQLKLIVLSFHDDKFSPNNSCKYALGRMGFFEGLGRNGGRKIRYNTIINFNQYNGNTLRECKTIRGQPFVQFHHDLFFREFPLLPNVYIHDNSAWTMRHSVNSHNFYKTSLMLFLKHAILFETFLLEGRELEFTMRYVLPAFQEIINIFGIKPLIVCSDDPDMEGDDYWQLYPSHLKEFAPYDRRNKSRMGASTNHVIAAKQSGSNIKAVTNEVQIAIPATINTI